VPCAGIIRPAGLGECCAVNSAKHTPQNTLRSQWLLVRARECGVFYPSKGSTSVPPLLPMKLSPTVHASIKARIPLAAAGEITLPQPHTAESPATWIVRGWCSVAQVSEPGRVSSRVSSQQLWVPLRRDRGVRASFRRWLAPGVCYWGAARRSTTRAAPGIVRRRSSWQRQRVAAPNIGIAPPSPLRPPSNILPSSSSSSLSSTLHPPPPSPHPPTIAHTALNCKSSPSLALLHRALLPLPTARISGCRAARELPLPPSEL
jgi:hypothetical protein